jgi:hypothetical protein
MVGTCAYISTEVIALIVVCTPLFPLAVLELPTSFREIVQNLVIVHNPVAGFPETWARQEDVRSRTNAFALNYEIAGIHGRSADRKMPRVVMSVPFDYHIVTITIIV